MKRLFCLLIPLALLLCLLPVAASAAEAEELSLSWSQGTYYDNAVNPNLVCHIFRLYQEDKVCC